MPPLHSLILVGLLLSYGEEGVGWVVGTHHVPAAAAAAAAAPAGAGGGERGLLRGVVGVGPGGGKEGEDGRSQEAAEEEEEAGAVGTARVSVGRHVPQSWAQSC